MQRARSDSRNAQRTRISLAILIALSSAIAQAQTRDVSEAAVLDSVTVTAQRHAEDPKVVPIAITTIADEKLDVIGSACQPDH